jgi:hypothetical protein
MVTTKARTTVPLRSEGPRWTVMVFMGADNLPDEADLSDEADADIAELQRVGSGTGLDIFVQRHGRRFVRRQHIGRGDPIDVNEDERDATNGNALIAFMRWALQQHRKDDHSLLVLWGHAYRFGIAHAPTRTGVDALDFAELRQVLHDFQDEYRVRYKTTLAPKLDILGFDACDLATVEMAAQLYPFADYLLASQIGMPLPGWPYHRVLDRLRKPQGERIMGPAELGSYAVRRFCEAYHAQQRQVSLTMLDLSRAPQLLAATEVLARRLAIAMDGDADEQALVADVFCQAQTVEDKPFVDVATLCLQLVRHSRDTSVTAAAKTLGDLLISPGPVVPGQSETGSGRPFVVEHGRNAAETAGLHGVSLYAPHVARDPNVELSRHFYEKFVFATETLWGDLVRALAAVAS